MKRQIRLTEGDLHRIVKRSVNKVLNEVDMSRPSILNPGDVNPTNYQPTDRVGVIMSSLRQLWSMDKNYTLDVINHALGTDFTL